MKAANYQNYLCLDELRSCTSSDPRDAEWIHACSWKDVNRGGGEDCEKGRARDCFSEIPCQSGKFEVCQIRPSAMYFSKRNLAKNDDPNGHVTRFDKGQGLYRVCYSSHSSRSELREFVGYFRPKKVIPSVKPRGMSLHQVWD